jgi:hypothetical protein
MPPYSVIIVSLIKVGPVYFIDDADAILGERALRPHFEISESARRARRGITVATTPNARRAAHAASRADRRQILPYNATIALHYALHATPPKLSFISISPRILPPVTVADGTRLFTRPRDEMIDTSAGD